MWCCPCSFLFCLVGGKVTALAYVHAPRPPYTRLVGPFRIGAITHSYGLSEPSSCEITLSPGDLQFDWLLPGMCWSVEQLTIGEPLWAGFVGDTMDIPYQPDAITIPLIGPKQALLSMEMAVRLPVPTGRGFAVQRALEAAQQMDIGMDVGIIEQEGAPVNLEVRGETVSEFIDTVRDASAGADWRERVEFNNK